MLSHSQKFIAVNPLLRVIVEVINGIPKSLSNNKHISRKLFKGLTAIAFGKIILDNYW